MVVGVYFTETMDPSQTPSTSLKFGMDRILFTPVTSTSYLKIKDLPSSPSNCNKCSSSLLYSPRCCRLSNLNMPNRFFNPSIYVPQPLRPYTNVVLQSEAQVEQSHSGSSQHKRKRSWSRAVFSNLQRKGLEKRFQLQKYITKPDRRQLAATLGLTDAQVKVWFQNRRMKWRHTKESSRDEHVLSKNTFNSEVTSISADSTQAHPNYESGTESDIDVQTVDS